MKGKTSKGAEHFNHVFVYGTLKRERGNHTLMELIDAEFIGFDTISGPFTMIDYQGFPAVCHDSNVIINTIFGQVFRIQQEGLRSLDALEGHPRWYRREKLTTDYLDKRAWMYLMPESSLIDAVVPHNMWHPTTEERKHWLRDPYNFEFAA